MVTMFSVQSRYSVLVLYPGTEPGCFGHASGGFDHRQARSLRQYVLYTPPTARFRTGCPMHVPLQPGVISKKNNVDSRFLRFRYLISDTRGFSISICIKNTAVSGDEGRNTFDAIYRKFRSFDISKRSIRCPTPVNVFVCLPPVSA